MAVESVRHHLSAAVRFVDAFTTGPVRVALDVRAETLPAVIGMPRVPWPAVRGHDDDTYRFLVTNQTVAPVGNVPVTVEAPGKEYADFEPLVVALPRPPIAHPPTPARSDFLVQHNLWPTRALKLPAGETALVAVLKSAGATPVARLRVTIWPDGSPQPAAPYAYSNDRGELVYRLPTLKTVIGSVISPVAALLIDLKLPPAYVAAVIPSQIKTDAGAVLGIPFSVRLGRVTNLEITLP
jgi:hypothetical protein